MPWLGPLPRICRSEKDKREGHEVMRYAAMQLLTWGTVAGAVGSALWLATLDEGPSALSAAGSTPAGWRATALNSQAMRPQALPGALADAASAPLRRR